MVKFGEAKNRSYIYPINKKIKVMKTLSYILLVLVLSSCYKHSKIWPELCDGNCDGTYKVIYKGQEILPNSNGDYEIAWDGLNYFQIEGQLTELTEEYCNADGVPFIETGFDSDYWVVFDTLGFQIPMYSYLGWFNDQSMNTPIAIGNHNYTINNLIDLHPPYNIAGYQIPKHWCSDCPAANSYIGSYSKYNYKPKQNFLLDNEMVGDEINIFIKTTFNTEGGVYYTSSDDLAPQETIETQITIIVI
jgi:hypothetical protein